MSVGTISNEKYVLLSNHVVLILQPNVFISRRTHSTPNNKYNLVGYHIKVNYLMETISQVVYSNCSCIDGSVRPSIQFKQ